MKKIVCIFIALLLMITLSGCYEQERAALTLLMEEEVQEELYTPQSYREYEAAISAARMVVDRKIVSAEALENAEIKLILHQKLQICMRKWYFLQ